ncbi:PAS domain-containing protein [Emcibacter sp.]|uniref:PAS domain-containing protein n=1 Tax=Emcibacter sp. TaxID=1979954 RepID=UPI002AA73739|nr:PAS domain-containing protein [Emcibacter sp.]
MDSSYIIIESPLTDSSLIRTPRLKQVLEFWEQNKSGDDVPLWKCFNPMEFKDLLPTISLFSNEGTPENPDYLLRLEGDQSAQILGLPSSMTKLKDADDYFRKTRIEEHLAVMAQSKKPVYFIRNLGWRDNKKYINYEILCMPFTSKEKGFVDRFLSVKTIKTVSLNH